MSYSFNGMEFLQNRIEADYEYNQAGAPMPTKIAIVDDSPSIRESLRSFIQSKTDWQVCGEAEDGAEAVTLVEQSRPDLLVLDLSMPVMNGLEAARKIAAMYPRVGIVLFTAHANEQLVREAKGAGISAVVQKDGITSLARVVTELRAFNATRAA